MSYSVAGLAAGPWAVGYSQRASASAAWELQSLGFDAWLSSVQGGDSMLIGLTDAEHTRPSGYRNAQVYGLSSTGWTVGLSDRFSSSADLGSSVWLADAAGATIRIGLTDAGHTDSSGFRLSFAEALYRGSAAGSFDDVVTPTGLAAGSSTRYDGIIENGLSTWIASTAGSFRVGLTDAEHTGGGGYQASSGVELTSSGRLLGHSTQYDGLEDGQSVWVANTGGTTTRLGYMDAEHTATGGHRRSVGSDINEAGWVAGFSDRFNGSTAIGATAWLANAASGTTVRVGLVDAEHTGALNLRTSSIQQLTESGYAAGSSLRSPNQGGGFSSWIAHTSGSTVRVGFFDAEHTRGDGWRESTIFFINESGLTTGISERTTSLGYGGPSAWVANAAGQTRRIGFIDQEHTRSDGFIYSQPRDMSQSGWILGTSTRYDDGIQIGESAWLANAAGTTTKIGLTDAEHTDLDGLRVSVGGDLKESGWASGYSLRYNGGSLAGRSAWVASAASGTIRVGLRDARHTSADGEQSSQVLGLTESGIAWGESERFDGTSDLGVTAWIFDIGPGIQHNVTLGASLNGRVDSKVLGVTESGFGFGSYLLYDEFENYQERLFGWSRQSGVFDLENALGGSLAAAGWSGGLRQAYGITEAGFIIAEGIKLSGDTGVLSVLIPEPGTTALLLAGITLLGLRRRRIS